MSNNGTPAAIVPELLTPKQAAALLNVGERTLWRYSHTGVAPAPIKLPGQVRYRRAELEAWIAAGCPRVGPPSETAEG